MVTYKLLHTNAPAWGAFGDMVIEDTLNKELQLTATAGGFCADDKEAAARNASAEVRCMFRLGAREGGVDKARSHASLL